jgi:hypothetical protein
MGSVILCAMGLASRFLSLLGRCYMHIQPLEIDSLTAMVSTYFNTARLENYVLHLLHCISYRFKTLARYTQRVLSELDEDVGMYSVSAKRIAMARRPTIWH